MNTRCLTLIATVQTWPLLLFTVGQLKKAQLAWNQPCSCITEYYINTLWLYVPFGRERVYQLIGAQVRTYRTCWCIISEKRRLAAVVLLTDLNTGSDSHFHNYILFCFFLFFFMLWQAQQFGQRPHKNNHKRSNCVQLPVRPFWHYHSFINYFPCQKKCRFLLFAVARMKTISWPTGKTNTSWGFQSNPQLVFVLPVSWPNWRGHWDWSYPRSTENRTICTCTILGMHATGSQFHELVISPYRSCQAFLPVNHS